MPKRVIDGEALWGSDKLAKVEPASYRAEYANLLPLALANGSFECNPRRIWATVYSYNRPDITPEDVTAMLDAFQNAKLLFRWEVDGKPWGYWVGIGSRLPKGTDYAHAKKGAEPPEAELIAFAGRSDRAATSQRPKNGRTGMGSGLGSELGVGKELDSELGVGLSTSPSVNPNSETNELRSNSSTQNKTATPTQLNPQASTHLDEVVEAMVTRYPRRATKPGMASDWKMSFRKGITNLAEELFDGKLTQAILFVQKKYDIFVEKSKGSDNVYGPAKFFSEWMDKDFDVKALRKKAREAVDWDEI